LTYDAADNMAARPYQETYRVDCRLVQPCDALERRTVQAAPPRGLTADCSLPAVLPRPRGRAVSLPARSSARRPCTVIRHNTAHASRSRANKKCENSTIQSIGRPLRPPPASHGREIPLIALIAVQSTPIKPGQPAIKPAVPAAGRLLFAVCCRPALCSLLSVLPERLACPNARPTLPCGHEGSRPQSGDGPRGA